ncbi:MAG: CDP-diacylglycerol--glycerol-3-phosphate 3-phosphatidyltransferase [Gammaproteobacteria bacterium]
MVRDIPNTLTWLRIALIPLFVLLFFLPMWWGRPAAAIVFGIAGLTDWLDGYLARKYEATTSFGAFLDPVADKLLVVTALVLLASDSSGALGIVVTLAATVIIGREITISALREWMAELGARGRVAVSRVGKYKTTAQIIALLLMLFRDPLFGLPVYPIGVGFLIVAATLTLWSMVVYLRSAWPFLNEERSGS